MRVLLEDNHLLAVAKPSGVATMGAAPGKPTVVERAKAYLKQKYDKPGEVYLGIVSRLDAPVTGVLLFARTSKAASRLTAAFRDRRVDKLYLAAVEGEAQPLDAPLVHYLTKDDDRRRMVASDSSGGQRAELAYRVVRATPSQSLLLVRLHTGRKHQIRVQLAKHGHPILGDRKYGARSIDTPGIGLHAWRLRLEHPVRREPIEILAPPPPPLLRRFPGVETELQRVAGEFH